MPSYDHPNYSLIREGLREATITAGAATGILTGSTFRCASKAVIIGVAAKCSAAGSGGTGVISLARLGTAGTASVMDVLSPLTLVLNANTIINCTSPITLSSIGESIALHGSSSAATDIAELTCVIYRYRLLPVDTTSGVTEDLTSAQLG